MDEKLPFVGEIVSHFLLVVISFLFFGKFYAFVFVFFLLAILVFRFNIWGFTAAILLGLATQYRFEGSTIAFVVSVLALLIGSVIELGIKAYQGKDARTLNVDFSVAKATLYAVLGSAIPLLLIVPVCTDPDAIINLLPNNVSAELKSLPLAHLFRLFACGMEFIGKPFGVTFSDNATISSVFEGKSGWMAANLILSATFLFIISLPSFWAALCASIGRAGLRHPRELVSWFLKVVVVIFFIGSPITSALLITGNSVALRIFVSTNSIVLLEFVVLFTLTGLIFIPAVIAGIITGERSSSPYSSKSNNIGL